MAAAGYHPSPLRSILVGSIVPRIQVRQVRPTSLAGTPVQVVPPLLVFSR